MYICREGGYPTPNIELVCLGKQNPGPEKRLVNNNDKVGLIDRSVQKE